VHNVSKPAVAKTTRNQVSLSIFVSNPQTLGGPTLLTVSEDLLPVHPEGGRWWLLATFYDNPRNLIIGSNRVKQLLEQGFVVVLAAASDVIKRRHGPGGP
jgi:hypothetical protein